MVLLFVKANDVKRGNQTLLRKKEVKRLKTLLTKQFPALRLHEFSKKKKAIASHSSVNDAAAAVSERETETETEREMRLTMEEMLDEALPTKQCCMRKLGKFKCICATNTNKANASAKVKVKVSVSSADEAFLPLFVDLSGRENYMPTVFLLWKMPLLLPRFTIHPPVSQFLVQKGADLMLPGVTGASNIMGEDDLASFKKGELRAVFVEGNNMPIGVGRTCMSAKDVADRVGTAYEGKGKVLDMYQVYGDLLYKTYAYSEEEDGTATATATAAVPNAGFDLHRVYPLITATAEVVPDEDDEDRDEDNNRTLNEVHEANSMSVGSEPADTDGLKVCEQDDVQDAEEEGGGGVEAANEATAAVRETTAALSDVQIDVVPSDKQGTTGSDGGNSVDEEEHLSQASRKEEDEKLLETFLQFCVTTLRDSDLPMPAEIFFSKMGRVRRASTELNLKKSTTQTIGKFLKRMKRLKLLRLKGNGKGKGKGKGNNNTSSCVIESIARKAGAFKHFTPYTDVALCPLRVELGKEKVSTGHKQATGSKTCQAHREVLSLYSPDRAMETILTGGIEYLEEEHEDAPHMWSPCITDPKQGHLYYKSTISSILNGYVQAEDLDHPSDKSQIVMDPYICDCLYANHKHSNDNPIPTTLTKRDFVQKCLQKCKIVYAVKTLPSSEKDSALAARISICKTKPKVSITVKSSKQTKGRIMTHVIGLEAWGVSPQEITPTAKKKFAASAITYKDMSKKNSKTHVLAIQGNVSKAVLKYLVKEVGVPTMLIETSVKR